MSTQAHALAYVNNASGSSTSTYGLNNRHPDTSRNPCPRECLISFRDIEQCFRDAATLDTYSDYLAASRECALSFLEYGMSTCADYSTCPTELPPLIEAWYCKVPKELKDSWKATCESSTKNCLNPKISFHDCMWYMDRCYCASRGEPGAAAQCQLGAELFTNGCNPVITWQPRFIRSFIDCSRSACRDAIEAEHEKLYILCLVGCKWSSNYFACLAGCALANELLERARKLLCDLCKLP